MTQLKHSPNFENGDDFYAELIAAHNGLSKEESDLLNAKLILILSNHIGDIDVIRQALDMAKQKSKIQEK